MRNIIIDTDPGHDDAIAIMLAAKSNLFNIRAITTVAGNSSIENTTRNARYILNLLGREDIPVYSGAKKPLKRKLVLAQVHGKSGLEGIDPKNSALLNGQAVDKMIQIIKSSPKTTLIAIGPLTNVAKAILKNPRAMKKIEQIVIMGGAIKVEGNKNRVAEFNFFVDPDAAKIVFDFPIKKVLVPLDACNNVPVLLEEFEKIKESKLKRAVLKMMDPYANNIAKYDRGIKVALMYDPLTIYYLINPTACKLYKYDLKIETKGELTSGMSVPELRNKSPKNYNVDVVMEINAIKFKRDLIKILSK